MMCMQATPLTRSSLPCLVSILTVSALVISPAWSAPPWIQRGQSPQSQAAQAPAAPHEEGATITPNYKDADLSQIIQAVSEVTGKNFIIDPRVNAKVTMLSATPMSP